MSERKGKPISVYQIFGGHSIARSLNLALVFIFTSSNTVFAAAPDVLEPAVISKPVGLPTALVLSAPTSAISAPVTSTKSSSMALAAEPAVVVPTETAPGSPPSAAVTSTPTVPATATDAHKKSSVYAIKAAVPTHPRAVVKNGNNFLLMEESGLMPKGTDFGYGLYRDDTRYLTEWDMNLNGVRLLPLSSNTSDGYNGRFLYGNSAYVPRPDTSVPEQTLLVQRDVVITDAIYERLSITNFRSDEVDGDLGIKFGADFADMFEVRGMPRKSGRGEDQPTEVRTGKRQVVLSYKGRDNSLMKTQITFMRETPSSLTADEAHFKFKLGRKSVFVIEVVINTSLNDPDVDPTTDDKVIEPLKKYTYERQKAIADQAYNAWRKQGATISSDNDTFNSLLERGYRDLYMLKQKTPKGECVAAGVPWFAVAFGRDQDIVGRETVALMPELSKSILQVLAEYQGTKSDTVTEEKSGKIMHELRLGEMARCKEIPFRPYYGTVDATPLWLMLLGDYVDWTGDVELAHKYWPNVRKALGCLDEESKSGYLTYGGNAAALSNQGWKDSYDSITTVTGALATPPIALSEAQGYLYAAWQSAAKLAKINKEDALAETLQKKAADLKQRFNKDFYSAGHKFMYIALADGKPCDVVSSNPGHCLATGILEPDRVSDVASLLMDPQMYCGWGVRTLAALECAYNPISYHDGSVWPHDNALVVEGLCKTNHSADGMKIMDSMFSAAQAKATLRLPELFCGFSRRFSGVPIWYPVSCEPQAWAAGSMFMMLKSGLGLQADALNHKLRVVNPTLPPFLTSLKIENLKVGQGKLSLQFKRQGNKTSCSVLSNTDDVTVKVE
ncbi:MAG TPA: glycogen debranching N-terminal domain-containing protein [Oculatellaceae cyanobacterium]